jgi:F0F1-type ATP synthase delta subunit
MTFQKVRTILKQALKEAEIEIIADSPDISDDELREALSRAKELILEEMGVDVQEFFEYEESLKEIGREKGRKKREEFETKLSDLEERVISQIPEIPDAPEPIIKTEVVKEIVKEVTKEVHKPQIIETVERVVDNGRIDDLEEDVKADIFNLQSTVSNLSGELMKLSPLKDIDISDYKKLVSGEFADKLHRHYFPEPTTIITGGNASDVEQRLSERIQALEDDESTAEVNKIIAGTGITISPITGIGNVTITNSLDLSGYVPYTGANANVDLGTHTLTAGTATLYGGTDNNIKIGGKYCSATGKNALAIGNGHAGDYTIASDNFALAIGAYAHATANSAFAMGNQAIASGITSFAMGVFAQAIGAGSISFGVDTWCYGDKGIVIGNYSFVGSDATNSIAVGQYACALNANEINFSNLDYTYGTENDMGGYTQLDIYNGLADFQGNSISCVSLTETTPTLLKLDQTTPQTITATDTTITASDEIYFGDATDSFKIKKDTIQGILDLTPAPDLSAYLPKDGATTGATSQSQIFTNGITLNATSIVTDTTTGLKIGTGTTQKIGFYNNTPIVKPTATTDLGTVLSNLGLRAAGTAYPITTSGTSTFSGTLKHSGSTLSFYNATGITKPAATVDLGTVLSNLGLRTAGTAYPLTTSGAVNLSGIAIIDRTDTEALLVRKASDGGDVFTVDTTNSKIIVGGATHQIGFTGDEGMLVLTTDVVTCNDDFKIASDTLGLWVGAGADAKIIYDGTNMVIDPKVVGSGYLSILGSVVLDTNETLALSGTGYVDSPKYKAGGTNPVADGTYTVGIGGTTNGTITIKGGIITAVQEAVA